MTKNFNKLICTFLVLAVCGCNKFPTANESVFNRLNKVSAISQDQIELQFGMARVTERNANPHEARRVYQQILEQQPNHAGSIHRLGVMLVKQDQVEESLTYFQSALEHAKNPTPNPKSTVAVGPDSELVTEILGDLGYAQYLAGDLENAEKNLTLAKQRDPSNERIVNNLAIVVGVSGDLKKSLFLFQAIGSEAEAMANLAFVQSQIGDLEGAKSSYHRALEKDSGLKVAANGLLELHQKVPPKNRQRMEPRQLVSAPGQALNQTQIASAPKERQVSLVAPLNVSNEAIEASENMKSGNYHLISNPVEQIQTQIVKIEPGEDSEVAINVPRDAVHDFQPSIAVPNKAELIQRVGFEETFENDMLDVVEAAVNESTVDKSKGMMLSPIVSPRAFQALSPIMTGAPSLKNSSHPLQMLAPLENKPFAKTPLVGESKAEPYSAAEAKPNAKKDMRPGIDANDFMPSESSK